VIAGKIIRLLLFILFIGLALSTGVSAQETRRVRAVGVADGSSSSARDEALNDALRKAVEQGVGTFVTSEMTVEQQKLVEERIYTESLGYIQSYDIVREGSSDGLYEVEISALVKMGKLAGDLESIGLLIRKKHYPRVMVVIYSREVDSSIFGKNMEGNRQVENQVEGSLLEKGFRVVDAYQLGRKKEAERLLIQGNTSKAAQIAKDQGAEILVVGEVRRSFVEVRKVMGTPTRFLSNEIRLKALETDTAKVLFSGYRTRPPSGAGSFVPLEDAASELIDEMVQGILNQWRKDVYQAGAYQLEVSNASFNELTRLKQGLKAIRGVAGVQVRNFRSGRALLEVRYRGPLEALAEKIGSMKGVRVEIMALQANTLEIVIKK